MKRENQYLKDLQKIATNQNVLVQKTVSFNDSKEGRMKKKLHN